LPPTDAPGVEEYEPREETTTIEEETDEESSYDKSLEVPGHIEVNPEYKKYASEKETYLYSPELHEKELELMKYLPIGTQLWRAYTSPGVSSEVGHGYWITISEVPADAPANAKWSQIDEFGDGISLGQKYATIDDYLVYVRRESQGTQGPYVDVMLNVIDDVINDKYWGGVDSNGNEIDWDGEENPSNTERYVLVASKS
jgi:hypothetical protein